jgi:NAD(P)-dependent dehydrogenase (short-subunit alcohol dehydrogenase family)
VPREILRMGSRERVEPPDGDVVILAGGTGRVGGATLARLLAGGSRVTLFSRDAGRAGAAIEREVSGAARERADTVVVDLADFGPAEAAVAAVAQRFGRIDAVISLAGGGSAWQAIVDSDPRALAESLRNNLYVAYNLLVPALRAMLRQQARAGSRSRGRLVAVTAGSSLDPAPARGIMGIGKAGVNTLMRAIAVEHKADGIVANAVILGGVATDAARAYLDPQEFAAAASPQEVAEVLAFHASEASTGINGELIHLNARETD